ncbi:MAG: hypothetical protein M1164_00135 [Candidatus Marsarchaeota archaeon]|jgi:hypothetical protein|nr:hypothetical protein [Candidatus Marsarchaeota archaeon]
MKHEEKIELMKRMHSKLLQNIDMSQSIGLDEEKRAKLEAAHEKIKGYHFVLQKENSDKS